VVDDTINNSWSSSENVLLIISMIVFFAIYLFVKVNLPLADLPCNSTVEEYQRSTSSIKSLNDNEF
jgi:hypothetical protein